MRKWHSELAAVEIPEIDMGAINAAIDSALSGITAEAPSKEEPAEAVKKKTTKEKAATISVEEVTQPKTERQPRSPRKEHPTTSPKFGTPINRVARDKCSVCRRNVDWYNTTDDAGTPIWECSECGKIAPRRERKKAE